MILLGPKTLNSLRRRRRHLQSLASVSAVAATHTHHHCNKQPPHINSSHVIILFLIFFPSSPLPAELVQFRPITQSGVCRQPRVGER